MDRIVCAANRNLRSKKIICSARHFDTLMHSQIFEQEREDWKDSEQGFINQKGEFLTRQEAWLIASAAGQIIKRVGGDEGKLFSENLY